MKKALSFLLCLCLTVGCLAGCNTQPPVDTTAPTTPSTTEPTTQPVTEPPKEVKQPPKRETPLTREVNYEDPDWYKDAMIIDIDGDWPAIYLMDDMASKDRMVARAKDYFSNLAGTNVTDVTICAFEQISYVPSETMEWIHEKAAKIVAESGAAALANYDHASGRYPALYEALTKYELDWYQTAVDCAAEAGIRPWLYLRMNDLHYTNDYNSPYHEDFWYEAVENGWLIGEGYGAGAGSNQRIENLYNFAHGEVRTWLLTYIEEMLMKYDVFGLQLDFMRNIYCFDYLDEEPGYEEIMTQFVRDVDALLQQAEAHHGHDMKLMIRLGRSIEHNLVYGFDVEAWVQEDLVDALVPSPEGYIDSGIPVDQWKALVGEEVAVFPGFENWMMGNGNPTIEQIKGYGASFYAMGADGLYFNNYYQLGSMGPEVWGYYDGLMSWGTRTYIVSDQDITPIGEQQYHPMPLALHEAPETGLDYEIQLGPVREDEYVYVVVGYNTSFKTEFVTEVTLNGMKPVKSDTFKPTKGDIRGYVNTGASIGFAPVAGRNIYYAFTGLSLEEGEPLVIHFTQNPGDKCNVEYLEVTVQTYEQIFW